ncbi:MAG: FAD-dependent thymidylate synthase, partial [Ilumatobacteraceae bacterium]
MRADVLGGFVLLDNYMADDLSVVNSARVSFGKRSTEMEEADKKLIAFLMREKHGTPFEHNSFRFHVQAPIFVAREWFRHRIGSFNELSGRYTEIPEKWYVPDPKHVRQQEGKPGHYQFTPMDDATGNEMSKVIDEQISRAFRTYHYMLTRGVAKEVARTVLPVGAMTEFWWTVNARSLMNFLSLRVA